MLEKLYNSIVTINENQIQLVINNFLKHKSRIALFNFQNPNYYFFDNSEVVFFGKPQDNTIQQCILNKIDCYFLFNIKLTKEEFQQLLLINESSKANIFLVNCHTVDLENNIFLKFWTGKAYISESDELHLKLKKEKVKDKIKNFI